MTLALPLSVLADSVLNPGDKMSLRRTRIAFAVGLFAISFTFLGCETKPDRPVMTTVLSSGKEIRLVSLAIAVGESPKDSVLIVECASQAPEDKTALSNEMKEILPVAQKTADLWGIHRVDVYPFQSAAGKPHTVYRCTKEKEGTWSVKDSLGVDFKLP